MFLNKSLKLTLGSLFFIRSLKGLIGDAWARVLISAWKGLIADAWDLVLAASSLYCSILEIHRVNTKMFNSRKNLYDKTPYF